MDELLNTISTGITWLAIGGGSYLAALAGAAFIVPRMFNKKIQSKKELDEIIVEEAEKLGLKTDKISSNYCDKFVGCGISNLGKDNWELCVSGWSATRSTVRHELYHLRRYYLQRYYSQNSLETEKNKAIKPENWLNYWLNEEPRAILYGTFKIKT